MARRAGGPADGVEALPGLGPTSAALLKGVGIETADALREAGAVLAYRALKHRHGAAVTLNLLYAMEGALQDRAWNSFSPDERAALRAEAAAGDEGA